jgi:hypothetical protein
MQYLKFLIKKSSFVALSVIVLSFAGCSKGGESPTPTPPVTVAESDIAFKVDIAGSEVNYSNVFAVVGTSIQMNANITSSLPKDGVTIDISVRKKLDNAVVFSSSLSSTTASNPFTVTGLTGGTLCVATIIVTSKSKSTNTSTKSFELAAK